MSSWSTNLNQSEFMLLAGVCFCVALISVVRLGLLNEMRKCACVQRELKTSVLNWTLVYEEGREHLGGVWTF